MALLSVEHVTRRFGGVVAVDDVTLDVGEGWFQAETRPDGLVYRLADSHTGQASDLVSMNLTQQPVPATLQFAIYTHAVPRTVAASRW